MNTSKLPSTSGKARQWARRGLVCIIAGIISCGEEVGAIQLSGNYFPSPVAVGGKLTCSFRLFNDQSDAASGTFTNAIPPSMVFVSATVTNGSYVISNNLFSYVPAPLAAGRQLFFDLVLTPVSAQLITNFGVWVGPGGDFAYSAATVPVTTSVLGPRMNVGRVNHNSTLLNDGRVLITGGYDMGGPFIITTLTAEVYDPAANEFRLVGEMSAPRRLHTSTLLPNGMVLVTGGTVSGSSTTTSIDLYDPTNQVFISAGSLSVPRATHSATLLPNGDVIVAGGAPGDTSVERFHLVNSQATVSPAGNLLAARAGHLATVLPDGEILFAGGADPSLSFAERFNPQTGKSVAVVAGGRSVPAVAIARGTVLLHGWTIQPAFAAELYDIESNSFAILQSAPPPASGENYLTLNTGLILITAGYFTFDASLFDPRTGAFSASYPLATTRSAHSAVELADGRVLLTGGYDFDGIMSSDSRSTELYALRIDRDQDGMDDAWELANGLDPTRRQDAIEDPDGDGFTNLQEYLAGTNPHDPSSYMRIDKVEQTANKLHIRFASVLGKFYDVERTSDLQGRNWFTIARNIAGTGNTIDLTDSLMAGSTNQLYRVVVVP